MRILQFRKPTPSPAVLVQQQDWSQQEMADFYRAHHLLSQNGVSIGIDRGQTEVGDPWMVFYDDATQDVFLHVARFDNQCVLICETLNLKLARPAIGDIITAFEEAVRDLITVRQERSSNVLLHPASRIIMSISAVFLLFKLENGGAAQAKALVDHAAVDASRKQDVGTNARLHQTLARIFDIADAPAAAAALAGAILSTELARVQLAADHQSSELVSLEDGRPSDSAAVFDPRGNEASVIVSPQDAADGPRPNETLPAAAVGHSLVDLNPSIQITSHVAVVASSAPQVPAQSAALPLPVTAAPQPSAESDHRAVQASNAPAPAAPGVTGGTLSSPAEQAQDAATPISLAARAVQTLLGDAALMGSDPATDAPTLSPEAAAGFGDISIADLPQLDAVVALFRETTLTGNLLTDTIIEFMGRFGSYDVEFAQGRVLIEQHDMAALSSDLIGIWTNIMEDGSAISVVGHVDLVTDVTTSLA